jgi:hypothetical protein
MTTRRNVVLAAALLLSLIPILFVLTASLNQLELAPGSTTLHPTSSSGLTSIEAPGKGIPRVTVDIFAVFVPLSLACVIVSAVASIRSRQFRKELIMFLVAFSAFALFYSMFPLFHGEERKTPSMVEGSPPSESVVTSEAEGPLAEDPAATNRTVWHVLLTALLAFVLFVCCVVLLIMRWSSRRRTSDSGAPRLDELAACAEEAADHIRSGRDVHGVVRRCYDRMSEILSKRLDIDGTCLTPREFSHSLERVGMKSEHVDGLTRVFELVQYGGRREDPFAEEAVACLDAVRAAAGAQTTTK